MNLESYKIIEINTQKGHIYITFTFKDEGKSLVKEKRFDYRVLTGFEDIQMQNQEVEFKDKDGKLKKKIAQVPMKVISKKRMIDVSNKGELEAFIFQWAADFVAGKELEKESNQTVSKDVMSLIGKTNKI